MTKKRSLTIVRIFMFLTQTALTGFMIFWLSSQYREAKNDLVSKLQSNIELAKRETIDSLIEVNILGPLLESGRGFKVNLETVDNVLSDDSNQIITKVTAHTNIDTLLVENKNDSTVTGINKLVTIKHDEKHKKDLLVNGVKLIVKKVNSINGDSLEEMDDYYLNSDSLLFRKTLQRHLDEARIPLSPEWIATDSTIKDNNTFIFSKELQGTNQSVKFSSVTPYLLKTISPQIIFGAILILLTAFAFILSHRNLQKQYRLDELKNNLISNISHELKTPVSTVKIALEEMKHMDPTKEKDKLNEYLNLSSQEMSRMEMLVSKVMNTGIMEEGRMVIDRAPTDIAVLIKETITQFKLKKDNANIELTSTINEPLILFIDPIHIKGVLINLIDNAIKYNDKNPIIAISIEQNNEFVKVHVKDNGPGISSTYMAKVFDKFFRVPQNDTHAVKGYGLGLNYCKQIMALHSGAISFECPNEGGCIFSLQFPRS